LMEVINAVSMAGAVRRQPVARKSAALRRRYIRRGVWLLALGVIMALLFVWVRIQVIHLGYEVSRLRKETRDLTEQRNMLEAKVSSLKSPERLMRIASQRFGMRLPQGDEIVFVSR
jgi:cell division protein FtsL